MLEPGMVAVVGVPLDENSSFMKGSAHAPDRIREALHSSSTNLCAENGIDLDGDPRWQYVGDISFRDGVPPFQKIEDEVSAMVNGGMRVLAMGGDHSITYPIVRAHAQQYTDLNILHLDAHPDLYDELEGNRSSHACPFARIMEEKLAARLAQVGIRTMNPHQRQQAERFEVEVFGVQEFHPETLWDLATPVYLSIDMDVLDPAFAPGVSHHEPGGFSTREILSIIQEIPCTVIGADIVELNPERDPLGITAMAAAKIFKEVLSLMLERPPE